MTTTDLGEPPTQSPTPPPTKRVLRRSRTDRVGAGVASGLGRYFDLDPVLFRVLFATAAFFGGAGVIAYLIAWAAIPEEGTPNAPIDGWVAALRRRRIPLWLVAVVAALVFWIAAFSWWAPGPFLPVVAVVVLIVVFLGRRDLQSSRTASTDGATTTDPADPAGATSTVDLTKTNDATTDAPTGASTWQHDARAWLDEARAAGRARRRRAMPVRWTIIGTLAATLVTLAIVDAVGGIPMQVYFWTTLGIVVLGLLVGAALRRAPWGASVLLVPAIIGTVAFAGSHASLHDGIGDRNWQPVAAPAAQYRLALGDGTLDLRHLRTQTAPRTVRVTMGAGQLRVLAGKTQNVRVLAYLHFGDVTVDQRFNHLNGGVGVQQTVQPPSGATGPLITVDVHVADGRVSVERA